MTQAFPRCHNGERVRVEHDGDGAEVPAKQEFDAERVLRRGRNQRVDVSSWWNVTVRIGRIVRTYGHGRLQKNQTPVPELRGVRRV